MSSLIPIARSLAATPAYSPVQNAILEQLRGRQGGDVLKAYHERQVKLASHIHDMQAVAAEMNLDKRGFADAKKQAAFSRALAGLVKSGAVTSHPSLVPIAEYWPDRVWSYRVVELANGTYLNVPAGPKWRRRFVSLTGLQHL